MSISFQCSACDKKLRSKVELVGKRVRCPGCGQITLVPGAQPAIAIQVEETEPSSIQPATDQTQPVQSKKTPEQSIHEAKEMSDLEILAMVGLKDKAINEGWGPQSVAFMASPHRQLLLKKLDTLRRVFYGEIPKEQADKEYKTFRPTMGKPPPRLSD